MSRNSLKFLQFSDLHLDRSFSSGRLKLPFEKARERKHELKQALERVVQLSIEQEVELILLPGDLWEEDQLDHDTVPFVMEQLESIQVPVVIAPGNHDYYSISSHYANEMGKSRFSREWSDNVYIFREYDWQHITVPELDGVSISGLACGPQDKIHNRLLQHPIQVPPADLNILVLHGSRDDHVPPGKKITQPFSDRELLAQPFDYIALGHYHTHANITDDSGLIRGAYSGATCSLRLSESGGHGVLLGTVRAGGVKPEDLKFHEIDHRQIHKLTIDVSRQTNSRAVEQLIHVEIENNEIKPEDICYIELTGSYMHGRNIQLFDKLSHDHYHLEIDISKIRPRWNPDDEGSTNSAEIAFKKEMKQLIDAAEANGDLKQGESYINSLNYGLDALHNINIAPP